MDRHPLFAEDSTMVRLLLCVIVGLATATTRAETVQIYWVSRGDPVHVAWEFHAATWENPWRDAWQDDWAAAILSHGPPAQSAVDSTGRVHSLDNGEVNFGGTIGMIGGLVYTTTRDGRGSSESILRFPSRYWMDEPEMVIDGKGEIYVRAPAVQDWVPGEPSDVVFYGRGITRAPEPSTWVMLATAVIGCVLIRSRMRA
jgi:hypothetical protein